MSRLADRDRILALLADSPEGLSNRRIKNELNLLDDRYDVVRSGLIDDGLVEKRKGRGGGLRLTSKGDREVHPEEETKSTVDKEEQLYQPLVAALLLDSPEDVVFDTSRLRKRGKWQNPDVTQITIEVFPRLRKREVMITSYEVKQWWRWDVNAVFEAASHARYAHDVFVVLEWPEKTFSLSDPRLDQIVRECQRFGVGLATLEPHYSKYRLYTRLEPVSKDPSDEDVENWLDYALGRRPEAAEAFEDAISKSESLLKNGKKT